MSGDSCDDTESEELLLMVLHTAMYNVLIVRTTGGWGTTHRNKVQPASSAALVNLSAD